MDRKSQKRRSSPRNLPTMPKYRSTPPPLVVISSHQTYLLYSELQMAWEMSLVWQTGYESLYYWDEWYLGHLYQCHRSGERILYIISCLVFWEADILVPGILRKYYSCAKQDHPSSLWLVRMSSGHAHLAMIGQCVT